ncbi:MAG: phage integrase N-terminal SAM-like domain-containing protein [candidate division KSB1 bacterium]|nr:phage integrase N-terminal SAM-like domain-containing protein [candidate division KSB1 bacterium]
MSQGKSERTIEMYIRSIAQLSTHYQKPPDQITEEELRQYFLYNKTHRNPKWIFPAPGRGGNAMPTTDKPIPLTSIQIAFKEAKDAAKIAKKEMGLSYQTSWKRTISS